MRSKIDRVSLVANELRELANQLSAPIDVRACAKQVGAQLTYQALEEDISGLLIKKEGRKIIGVNSTHAPVRQRFTIGHEIGHLLLQHQGDVFVDQTVIKRDLRSSQAIDAQEIEANRFAAELLMPESLVMARVREFQGEIPVGNSTHLIDLLATEFEVSTQAMQFRLINLGVLIPG